MTKSFSSNRRTFFRSFLLLFLAIALPLALLGSLYTADQLKAHRRQLQDSMDQELTVTQEVLRKELSLIIQDILLIRDGLEPLEQEKKCRSLLAIFQKNRPDYTDLRLLNNRAEVLVSARPRPLNLDARKPAAERRYLSVLSKDSVLFQFSRNQSSPLWTRPMKNPELRITIPLKEPPPFTGEETYLELSLSLSSLSQSWRMEKMAFSGTVLFFSSRGETLQISPDPRESPFDSQALARSGVLQELRRRDKASLSSPQGLYRFRTFRLSQPAAGTPASEITVLSDRYILLAHIPADHLQTARAGLYRRLLPVYLTFLLLTLTASLVYGYSQTRRHSMEREYLRHAQRSFSILRGIPDYFISLDRQGTVLSVNPARGFREILPQPPTAGRSLEEYLPGDLSRRILTEASNTGNRSLISEEDSQRLVHTLTSEGRQLHYEIRLLPLDGGEILVILRNITQEKEQQSHLIFTYHLLRGYKHALDKSAVILRATPKGVLTDANSVFLDFLGLSLEDIRGLHLSRFLPPETLEDSAGMAKRILTSGQILDRTLRLPTPKEPDPRYVDTSAVPILDNKGNILEVICIGHDVTALKRAVNEARQAEKSKDVFLAQVSHEIRTPLNGIIGFGEIIREQGSSGEERRYAELIIQESEKLLTIINQILSLSKLESGQDEAVEQDYSLRDIMISLEENLGRQARRRGLSYSWKIDPDIPAFLRGDPLKVWQILMNIVGNAVKFTHTGGVSLQVRRRSNQTGDLSGDLSGDPSRDLSGDLSGDPSSEMMDILVRDTGIGISKDQQDAVFAPFIQVSSGNSRVFEGTGLGTSISLELCRLLGGDITMESTPNRGSCFTISLPFRPGSPHESRSRSASTGFLKNNQPDFSDKTLLLVEDYPPNRELTSALLEPTGAHLLSAESGEEALEILQEEGSVDLILMDIQMPGMDGFETTRRLRQEGHIPPTLPILALTANAFLEGENNLEALGIQGVLTKPIRIEQFLQALAAHLLTDQRRESPADIKGEPASGRKKASSAVPTAAEPSPVIDWEELKAEWEGSTDVLISLFQGFLSEAEESCRRMGNLLQSPDGPPPAWREELHREAHALKGGALNLAAPRLARKAFALEKGALPSAGKSSPPENDPEIPSAPESPEKLLDRLDEVCREKDAVATAFNPTEVPFD